MGFNNDLRYTVWIESIYYILYLYIHVRLDNNDLTLVVCRVAGNGKSTKSDMDNRYSAKDKSYWVIRIIVYYTKRIHIWNFEYSMVLSQSTNGI